MLIYNDYECSLVTSYNKYIYNNIDHLLASIYRCDRTYYITNGYNNDIVLQLNLCHDYNCIITEYNTNLLPYVSLTDGHMLEILMNISYSSR